MADGMVDELTITGESYQGGRRLWAGLPVRREWEIDVPAPSPFEPLRLPTAEPEPAVAPEPEPERVPA